MDLKNIEVIEDTSKDSKFGSEESQTNRINPNIGSAIFQERSDANYNGAQKRHTLRKVRPPLDRYVP